MPRITESKSKSETPVALSILKGGEVFRFAEVDFIEAVNAQSFYMRLDAPELQGRIRVANLTDGKVLERDSDRMVYKHNSSLEIFR